MPRNPAPRLASVIDVDEAGLSFACPSCGSTTRHPWHAIDALQHPERDAAACVLLPTCSCGAKTFLQHTDEDYSDDPCAAFTAAAVREQIATRGRFIGLAKRRVRRGAAGR